MTFHFERILMRKHFDEEKRMWVNIIRNMLPLAKHILMCPSLSDLSTTLKILSSNVTVKGTCGLFAITSKRALAKTCFVALSDSGFPYASQSASNSLFRYTQARDAWSLCCWVKAISLPCETALCWLWSLRMACKEMFPYSIRHCKTWKGRSQSIDR